MEDFKIKVAEWLPEDAIVLRTDKQVVWYQDGKVHGPFTITEISKKITSIEKGD